MDDLGDDEGSFLGWRQLVHVLGGLDPSQDEVADLKCSLSDILVVALLQHLLVLHEAEECCIMGFIQLVKCILPILHFFGFVVC